MRRRRVRVAAPAPHGVPPTPPWLKALFQFNLLATSNVAIKGRLKKSMVYSSPGRPGIICMWVFSGLVWWVARKQVQELWGRGCEKIKTKRRTGREAPGGNPPAGSPRREPPPAGTLWWEPPGGNPLVGIPRRESPGGNPPASTPRRHRETPFRIGKPRLASGDPVWHRVTRLATGDPVSKNMYRETPFGIG